MNLSWLCLLVALVLFSCNKKNNNKGDVCGVDNPITELHWLKQKVDAYREENLTGQVMEIQANGRQYLNVQLMISSCFMCDLYTCGGRKLKHPDDADEIADIMQNLERSKVVASF